MTTSKTVLEPVTSGSLNSYLSLRARQLLCVLLVVGLGIFLLGGGYLKVWEDLKIEKANTELRDLGESLELELPVMADEVSGNIEEIDPKSWAEFSLWLRENQLGDNPGDYNTEREKFIHVYEELPPGEGAGRMIWNSSIPKFLRSDKFNHQEKVRLTIPAEMLVKEERFQRVDRERLQKDGVSFPFFVWTRTFEADDKTLRIVVAKSKLGYDKEVDELLKTMIFLFLATLALVLISQVISNYFIITPIRDFESEVKQIEKGLKHTIEKQYPSELTEVKGAINTLINVEKGQKQRYRDSLDDLAHSLKTPLAGMQSTAGSYDMPQSDRQQLLSHIEDMSELIGYHLKRAAVRTPGAIVMQEPIRPTLLRLRNSLFKVYKDKQFDIELNVDEFDMARLENSDQLELFGNLLNNACRFCVEKIEVSTQRTNNFLIVNIEDDGLGFGIDNPKELLQRGIRGDSKTEGQGIGLAICNEIVEACGGKIELLPSKYMGANVRLYLPH